ncbi:MAG: hypothetical protein V2A66_03790 [Pseudomonadota bacterium]
MNILTSTLKEELSTARRLEKRYLMKIAELSPGSFFVRPIRGGKYAYLNRREGRKVVQHYLGKATAELVESYRKSSAMKKDYQKKLKNVREQIKMLERALRGNTA